LLQTLDQRAEIFLHYSIYTSYIYNVIYHAKKLDDTTWANYIHSCNNPIKCLRLLNLTLVWYYNNNLKISIEAYKELYRILRIDTVYVCMCLQRLQFFGTVVRSTILRICIDQRDTEQIFTFIYTEVYDYNTYN